jgi:hypothetical protein
VNKSELVLSTLVSVHVLPEKWDLINFDDPRSIGIRCFGRHGGCTEQALEALFVTVQEF